MIQPYPQQSKKRTVTITCFTCNKEVTLHLKPWQLERKITCPLCDGKQAIISSVY